MKCISEFRFNSPMIKSLLIPAEVPVVEIPTGCNVQLFVKREDLIHPEISGNKFWKLYHNLHQYLSGKPKNPMLITFGGAFSNHIAAVASFGKMSGITTLGIIRGEEIAELYLENATLSRAHQNGMHLRFVSRDKFRNKDLLTEQLQKDFPEALIIPEGGTNESAVEGVRNMLSEHTKDFDYLCTAVGTGGTVAGISKFCEENQQVIGFQVVKDSSVDEKVLKLSGRTNFYFVEAAEGGYGKINDESVRFINSFYRKFGIPLDPVYTGKMMKKLLELIADGYFPSGSRILAFHTGGLQGIEGANQMLKSRNRTLINFQNGEF